METEGNQKRMKRQAIWKEDGMAVSWLSVQQRMYTRTVEVRQYPETSTKTPPVHEL